MVVIKKPGKKDVLSPKSFRPICLLSVIGKLLEKLIAKRIAGHMDANGLSTGHQYGFTAGRRTDDALDRLVKRIESMKNKFGVGMFFDIEGAFNKVWWPLVLVRLQELGIPKNIYAVMADYFKNRSV